MCSKRRVRGWRLSCLLGVVVSLYGATGAAEEAQEAGDLWIGAEAYAGYTSGTYRFEGPVNPGYGQTGDLALSGQVSGTELGLAVFAGAALADRWAIGALSHASLFFGSTDHTLAGSEVSLGTRTSLELAAQYWLHSAWHARLSAGIDYAYMTGSSQDYGGPDNIVEFEGMTGPVGHLLLGWKPHGIGAFLRGGFAYLEGEQSRYTPFDVVLGVSFATL